MKMPAVGALLAWFSVAAVAQTPPQSQGEMDPMGSPTEHGVRFTPGLARAFGRLYARELLVNRYELDKAKVDETGEVIARRLMELAHKNEQAGQEFLEYVIGEGMNLAADSRQGNAPSGIPPEMGRGIAERVTPLLPSIREMMTNVVQDVRPKLSLKQQLKFSADAAIAMTAMDSLEKAMQRWSTGDVKPFEDPFRSEDAPVVKDQNGETEAGKRAKKSAETAVARKPWTEWEKYVDEAKKYYALDPSQAASADSLLREYVDRAKQRAADPAYQASLYRNRLWSSAAYLLRGGWNNPLRAILGENLLAIQEPITAIGDEMKRRIDEIPTAAQREAADARIRAALVAKGFEEEKMTSEAAERQ